MSVGTRLPAYATSVGKILLATIDDATLAEMAAATRFVQITQFTITEPAALMAAVRQARQTGWAMNDQETVVGLRSLAVPIVLDGHTLAALGASAQTARISMGEMIDRYVPALHRATVSIAEMLRTKNVTQQTLSSLSSPAGPTVL
jgi:IclR family pca regulon transcriptional regulator